MAISIQDLFKVPLIFHIDLSRDGKHLLYSSNPTGIPHLYTAEVRPDAQPRKVTEGRDAVLFGLLSPEGGRVVYAQDRDGNELHHLYLVPREGGEAERITERPLRTWGVDWHPSGWEVARTCAAKASCLLEVINLKTGESHVLREQPQPFMDVRYSHNGRWLACTMRGGGRNPANQQIVVINRMDPEDVITYSLRDGSKERFPSWSPDDRWLAFLTDVHGRNQVVIQEFQGTDRIFLELAGDEEVADHQAEWAPEGGKVYYIVSRHSRTTLREHSIGEETGNNLPFPTGTISLFKVDEARGRIIALHSSMSTPPTIYLHEPGSEAATPITMTKVKIDLSKLSKPESVWYTSFDGRRIHGWYLPAALGNPPYPAVLWVHGGPWWQVFDAWSPYLQAFSQSGFAVFAPNFRGSTGYGAEFRNLDLGDPGGGDLKDVVYGARWLRGRPEVDGSRIAIVGGSYGGFMTLIALTKEPEVFAAGVAIVPVADWLEMFGLSDSAFKHFMMELFQGSPEQKEQLYRDRSPITYVERIQAPVMIIHGRHDSRCPIQPVEKFVRRLRELGHPHEFVVEEREGHGFRRVDAMLRETTHAIEYLKRVLG